MQDGHVVAVQCCRVASSPEQAFAFSFIFYGSAISFWRVLYKYIFLFQFFVSVDFCIFSLFPSICRSPATLPPHIFQSPSISLFLSSLSLFPCLSVCLYLSPNSLPSASYTLRPYLGNIFLLKITYMMSDSFCETYIFRRDRWYIYFYIDEYYRPQKKEEAE